MADEVKPKKSIWKKWWFWLIVVFVIIIVIVSIGGNEKEKMTPEQQLPQEQTEEAEVISYVILREWKPDKDPKAIGMEILIAEEDVSKENIINLVKYLGADSEKANIRIFQDKEAWEQEKIGNYGEIYDRGYLAVYVKNLTGSGVYRGYNVIRWVQEKGVLEDLFGEDTKL